MSYRFRRNGTKYNASKTVIDGITFDSRKEANRYCELKLLEKGGIISDLRLQAEFELIPAQYEPDTVTITKTGKEKIVKGKCIERKCSYLADFVYTDNKTGETVVEDTKSPATRTKEYIIKRKLMLYKYRIRIREI